MTPRRAPRSAGPPRDRPLVLALGLGLLAYYGLTLGGHHYSIDGIIMFESAKRLLFDQSLVLDPPVLWGGIEHRVSPYGIGLSLAYLPALAALAPFASRLRHLTTTAYDPSLPYNPELYSNLPYLLSSWVNPLITAATGCLVLVMARRLGLSRPWSVGAALVFAIASPGAVYARFDFAQPLAGLALCAALIPLASGDRVLSTAALGCAGAGLAGLILTRPDLTILVPWVIAGAILQTRRLRDGVVLTLPVALAFALQLLINWARHGNPLSTGYGPLSDLFSLAPIPVLRGIAGLLLGPSHGLLVFFPLAWLSALGLRRLARERSSTARLWAGLIAIPIVFYATYGVWWAGWSWGPRFLLPLVPLLAVAATFWAARASRRGQIVFAALTLLGVAIAWNGVAVDFVLFNRWLEHARGSSAVPAGPFGLWQSPLLSGWTLLTRVTPDLLWVHLWKLSSPSVSAVATAAVVVLSAGLGVSAYRVTALLRSAPDPPARPHRRRR